MSKFIKLHPDDHVAVCLEAGQKGESASIDGLEIVLFKVPSCLPIQSSRLQSLTAMY